MKRIGILLLALLLCGSLFACQQVQNVQDAFYASAEGSMIGKTFQEVEAAFGSLFIVYFEEDRPAGYVFSKSNVLFHFDAPQAQAGWKAQLTDGLGFIPGAVALRDIRPTDLCIGVSGRIRDFGASDGDVSEISRQMNAHDLTSYETGTNTVYTLATTDARYEVYLYCAHGETAVTPDHQIRVMMAGAEAAAAEEMPTAFSFGGTTIPVGATQVEVRGTSSLRKTVTKEEFADLVKYCPALTSLILDYCDVEGQEQVGELTGLTTLELMSCNLPDISFVSSLKKLTRLGVCHNRLTDVSAIEGLRLTYLNLGDNPGLDNNDLYSVGKVTSLNLLYLYSLNISSLSNLRPLKKLNTLNVDNDARITETTLVKLSGISSLRKLQISNTGVTSLDFITTHFSQLRELEARKMKKLQNPAQSFCQLAGHPHLNKMTLGKDIEATLNVYTMAKYGANAADWFKTQKVTVTFK